MNTYYNLALCETHPGRLEEIILFPNPASTYFHIYGATPLGISSVSIIDSRGKLIYVNQLVLNNYAPVNINRIPPGVYIVKIINESRVFTNRLVVSK